MSPSDAMVGFVVAGGQSRRMGRDKALLAWEGRTLLDHAIARLRSVCEEVRVLSGPQPRYADCGLPVDVDEIADAGPLAGLATALAVSSPRPALLLGIDIPFASPELLAHVRDTLMGWDAVVPAPAAGPEPLCAAYGAACLGPVRESLAAGARKMSSFWPAVRVRMPGGTELARFGPPERLFRNVNDLAEYAAARADQRCGPRQTDGLH